VLARHVAASRLLRLATAGALLGALLLWWDRAASLGPVGLAVTGFTLAPVYPLLIAETPGRLGSSHVSAAVGFQVAAASLGTAALPGLAGLLAARMGLEVIGPFLFCAAAVLLCLHEIAARWARATS